MRRHLYIIAAILFTLSLAGANIRPPASLADPDTSVQPERLESLAQVLPMQSQGKVINILFHGLMVGRYKPGEQRFQVGIVRGYNHEEHEYPHIFGLQIWNGSGNPTTINVKPNEVYVFEVLEKDGESSKSPLIPYEPHGEIFSRTDPKLKADSDKSQDYRYAPDIEDFDLHNVKKDRRKNPFKYVFQVYNGVLKSKCLTDDFIEKKVPNGPWTCYGYVAEILGVEYTLSEHQTLVLRRKNKKSEELWRCTFNESVNVEARVLHLPQEEIAKSGAESYLDKVCNCANTRYKSSNSIPPADYHFQLYYDNVINVPKGERFRLRSTGRKCIGPRAVFPYQCGILLQGKTTDDIDGDDMP